MLDGSRSDLMDWKRQVLKTVHPALAPMRRDGVSRREFLKAATVGGAAVLGVSNAAKRPSLCVGCDAAAAYNSNRSSRGRASSASQR